MGKRGAHAVCPPSGLVVTSPFFRVQEGPERTNPTQSAVALHSEQQSSASGESPPSSEGEKTLRSRPSRSWSPDGA